jgi:hypothetical protein
MDNDKNKIIKKIIKTSFQIYNLIATGGLQEYFQLKQ